MYPISTPLSDLTLYYDVVSEVRLKRGVASSIQPSLRHQQKKRERMTRRVKGHKYIEGLKFNTKNLK